MTKIFLFFIMIIAAITLAQTNYSEINGLIEKGDYSKAKKLINVKINEENIQGDSFCYFVFNNL